MISSTLSLREMPYTVAVVEQSHVSFEGVDNQIGKRLLLFSPPGVASPRLVLQKI